MAPAPALRAPALVRFARALREGVEYGPPYAAARYFMGAPEPLDPETTWRFFTRRQPALIQTFLNHYPPPFQRRRLLAGPLSQSHAAGIEEHYDVSNEFYRLFLDRDFMFYSCADFAPGDTIEMAQRRKADHILSLLAPAAGEKVLELGCGWGSMLRHIHAHTGDKDSLWGYTLSQEQARYIRENFGFNVEIRDFIETAYEPNSYDKIYSIGAMEHVRPDEILPLLRKLHKAIRPRGRLVQHFFSLNTGPLPPSMIAAQLFFPGSTLATHAHHLEAAREAGFTLTHDTLHDYRPTLRAWFDRLVENRERALELVGLETYNKYLVFFAISWPMFDLNIATLHRLVFEKR
jgi:cyclopropane-fatty-acyl-phospholipid synthase